MNMSFWEADANGKPQVEFPPITIDATGVKEAVGVALEVIQMCHAVGGLEVGEDVPLYLLMMRDAIEDLAGCGQPRATNDWAFRRARFYTACMCEKNRFWQAALAVIWWALEPAPLRSKDIADNLEVVKDAYSVWVGAM